METPQVRDIYFPILSEIPTESYRRAEDHRAHVLLDKTALIADDTSPDKFRLGFTLEDRRNYASLTPEERKSFDEELAALARINTLMRMSRRWESCKFESPSVGHKLGTSSVSEDAPTEATEPPAGSTDVTATIPRPLRAAR